jgi:pimeloyl-ACP methyl ester carboxylesterase
VLYSTPECAPGAAEEHRAELRRIRSSFGLQEELDRHPGYPSLVHDEEFRRSMATLVRASSSPSGAVDFLRTYFETDISDVLPLIRVPTLLLYRPEAHGASSLGPVTVPKGEQDARRLADAIPDARIVSVPGPDHSPLSAMT